MCLTCFYTQQTCRGTRRCIPLTVSKKESIIGQREVLLSLPSSQHCGQTPRHCPGARSTYVRIAPLLKHLFPSVVQLRRCYFRYVSFQGFWKHTLSKQLHFTLDASRILINVQLWTKFSQSIKYYFVNPRYVIVNTNIILNSCVTLLCSTVCGLL